MSFLEQWNALAAAHAAEQVLPCCGSQAWARALVARRPLGALQELLAASDSAWWSLPASDWQEAFDSHPRLGQTHAAGIATAASLQWSEGEQSAVSNSEEAARTALAEGNRAYEARFHRVFLLRAAGRSAAEMLDLLQRRMRNTPEAELRESAEQQREITHLRLRRWLTEHERAAA